MIIVRVRIHPTLGREADVRTFMTEWVQAAQADGERVGLTQRIYSSEGPSLMVPRWFEDMAAADARRRENAADAAWQKRLATLSTMIRQPVQQVVEEMLVPVGLADTTPGVIQRAFFYPAVDKVGEMRKLLTEFVHEAHAGGRAQVGLGQQIFSESGPSFAITATFADVPELDRRRQERAGAIQALATAAGPLSRAPIAVRLLQVIVPPNR